MDELERIRQELAAQTAKLTAATGLLSRILDADDADEVTDPDLQRAVNDARVYLRRPRREVESPR